MYIPLAREDILIGSPEGLAEKKQFTGEIKKMRW